LLSGIFDTTSSYGMFSPTYTFVKKLQDINNIITTNSIGTIDINESEFFSYMTENRFKTIDCYDIFNDYLNAK
jgi:hypothetical protein